VTAPTVTVELYGSLAQLAGEPSYEIEARTIRDVLSGLATAAPAIAERLDGGVSVSIDGRIYTEALFEQLTPENEIIILPRIAGG
jgi:molybdopterin converting factor small subunit